MREKLPTATRSLPTSFKDKATLCGSPSFWAEGDDSSLSTPYITSPDTSSSALYLTGSNSSHDSLKEWRSPESQALIGFELPTHPEGLVSEMKLVPFRGESPGPHRSTTTPTFPSPPPLRLCSVSRQLHTPLSFFGSQHLQVSDSASSGLDLKLYAFFFGVIP